MCLAEPTLAHMMDLIYGDRAVPSELKDHCHRLKGCPRGKPFKISSCFCSTPASCIGRPTRLPRPQPMKPLALVVIFFAYRLCRMCHPFLFESQLNRASLVTKTALAAPISVLPDAPVSTDRYPELWPSVNHKETEFASLVSRVPQPGPICRRDCI